MSETPPPPQPDSPRSNGLWLILAGVGVAVLGFLLGQIAAKGMALVGIGVTGVLMGIGFLIWPWSAEMVAVNFASDTTLRKFWRVLPLFWKLWFVGSLVIGVAVMFAAVLLW